MEDFKSIERLLSDGLDALVDSATWLDDVDGEVFIDELREAHRLLLEHARAKAPYRKHMTRDYTPFDRAHDALRAFAHKLENNNG